MTESRKSPVVDAMIWSAVPEVGLLAHEPGDEVGRALNEGWFEGAEQAVMWLWLRSGDHMVDAGAHVGLFTLLAARAVGRRGRVLAVEPDERSHAYLKLNLARHRRVAGRVQVVEAALWEQPGLVRFLPGEPGRQAFSRCAVASATAGPGIRVRAERLDQLLQRHDVNAALMKLDLEGSEYEAMLGAGRFLSDRCIPLIQVEFSAAGQAAAGRSVEDLRQLWSGWGYVLCGLDSRHLRLLPVSEPGASGNLWAVADVEKANRRLASASAIRQDRARALIRRSEIAWRRLLAHQAEEPLCAEIAEVRRLLAAKEEDLQQAHRLFFQAGESGRPFFRKQLQRFIHRLWGKRS